jgi:tRNA nucleotidyltransferase (CCA-adding enzyme)
MNIKFYKVGGCVRDAIMGVKAKDIDYAVEAPSYEAMRDYIAERGKIYQERPEFFTVRAKLNGEDCDYVLCRKEGFYSDGRRPDVVEMGTIIDDLSRRDFTCNAIAQAEDGTIIDPFDGAIDIANKRLRCVGSPDARFSEDSLRMIRALRFAITKGFEMSPSIHLCLCQKEMVEKLEHCSIHRIRDELLKCFALNTIQTLQLLAYYHHLNAFVFRRNLLYLVPTIRELVAPKRQ